MSQYCFEVPPRSRNNIIDAAVALREALKIKKAWFPILHVVETLLPLEIPDFSFEVKEMWEMGDDHGRTYPENLELWLREDVYEGVRQGKGRDRFTLAHELGHLLLHNQPGLARTMKSAAELKPFRNSEWQANSFAGALLIPTDIAVQLRDPLKISEVCGVTVDAAVVQLRVLQQKGVLS